MTQPTAQPDHAPGTTPTGSAGPAGSAGKPKAFFSGYRPKVESLITCTTLAIIFLVWFEVTRRQVVPKIFIPSPHDVLMGFNETIFTGYHGKGLAFHCLVSLGRVLLGWVVACFIAVPLGLAMGLSSKVRAVFDYLIEFYRPLPPLAYYTLLVLWFGIGELSKVLLLFLAAIPPLTIGAVEGVREISPSIIQAARSLGANSRQVFYRIILPATTPAIITSMRISLGFTYTVLVAAEIVAATEGIGWMVWDASKFMRSDIIFVGIITMGATGIGLDACLRIAARRLLRWKYN
ncbi:ABC transporter permease [Nitratidesulfovibrio termitidis]|uniref:ABC transporter permease n=1 Tax=Nitratidesulfovibrio termitidis TaxID=42252 RepID=UPI0004127B20|nr:ABC transporter permease [Nitratidesulfovibrio termitidis]